jgi:hypothetical protein
VTLFGIILTPVFFYIIDTVSESHFFASPRVRRIGGIVLGILILLLGPLWLIFFLCRWSGWSSRPTAKPASVPELPPAVKSESQSLEFVEEE